MKNTDRYIMRLALLLLTLTAYCLPTSAATDGDGGATLAPIATKYVWVADDQVGRSTGLAGDTYYNNDTIYVSTDGFDKSQKYKYGGNFYGVPISWKRGIGIKLDHTTGRTYEIKITFIGVYGGNTRGVGIKRTANFVTKTNTNFVASLETNDSLQTLTYTATDITETDNTFWITGCPSSGGDAYLVSFTVIPHCTSSALRNFGNITGDYTWRIGNSEFSNTDPIPANELILKTSGTQSVGCIYHLGTEASPNTATTVLYNGVSYYTVDLHNDALSFKIVSNNKGIVNFFYREGGSFHVYVGDDYATATEVTLQRRLVGNNAHTYMATLDFNTSSGTTTFWIDGNCSLGGFDVLCDKSKIEDAASLSALISGSHKIGSNIVSIACPYLSGASNLWSLPSGIPTNGKFIHMGPKLPINAQCNEDLGPDSKTVMLDNRGAIGFKMPSNKMVHLRIYVFGDAGTGIQVKKGATPESATVIEGGTYNCTGNYFGSHTFIVPTFQSGSSEELYWIQPTSRDFVYFGGFKISLRDIDQQLSPIYYQQLITEELIEADDFFDDTNFYHQGSTDLRKTENTLKFAGLDMPIYNMDPSHYIGFKIAQGKKGTIRAYYTGKSVAQDGDALERRDLITVGYGGWAAEYDRNTHTITYQVGGGAKGWYNENYDYSDYTHLEIVLSDLNFTDSDGLAFGIWANFNSGYDADGRRINEPDNRTDDVKLTRRELADGKYYLTYLLHPSYKDGYSQICITCNKGGTAVVESAKLVNYTAAASASVNLYNGGSDTDHTGATQVASVNGSTASNCSIKTIDGTYIMEYPFDTTTSTTDQIFWVNGDMQLAVLEIAFDKINSDILWWYVNPDCKQVYLSELDVPEGIDEYAQFVVSKGRKAKFSFFMPYTMQCLYNNSNDASSDGAYDTPSEEYEYEYDRGHWTPLGKNTCWVEIQNGGNYSQRYYPRRFDDSGNFIKTGSSSAHKSKIFKWIGEEDISPTLKVDNTAFEEGLDIRDFAICAHQGDRQWMVYLQFIYFDPPVISATPDVAGVEVENDNLKDDIVTHYYNNASQVTISIVPGQNIEGPATEPIYYTFNSNDPDDLTDESLTEDQRFATGLYNASTPPVLKHNGIVSAAQYINLNNTPLYTDGPGSLLTTKFKLISEDLLVSLKDNPNMIYVKQPSGGFKSTGNNDGRFSNGRTDFTAGSIDVLKSSESTPKNLMHFMYGTTGVKYMYSMSPSQGGAFRIGGVKWDSSGSKQDWAYNTFIDAFKFHMEGSNDNTSAYSNNGNPYTECNQSIGGGNTENGGMFLTPVSADFFRMEPEYDGVVTLWIRQNGSTDDSTMDDGNIYRRPVYIMDENARIMRATTIKPTADNYLAIDGVYAVNSGRSEYRYDYELTWKHGVYGAQGWSALDRNYRVPGTYKAYGYRFFSLPEIDATIENGSGNTVYGTRYDINRFQHHSSFPLYRDDTFANWETTNGINYSAAKYGFEVPNYTYMRYRIPVKAGKSYYLGGSGTKNGFVAVQFDILDANYSNLTYRHADNPTISGNGQHGPLVNWDFSVPTTLKNYDYDTAIATYSTLDKYVLDGDQPDPTYLASTKVQGEYWWEDGAVDVLRWQGANPEVGTTIDVELRRTFKAGCWYPIVLPFSVSETRMQQYFGKDVKVLYLDPKYGAWLDESGRRQNSQPYHSVYRPAINDSKLNFTYHKYQMLYANTPAFICPTFTWDSDGLDHPTVSNGTVSTITFERVNYAGGTIKSYDIGNGYEVTGSYAPTTATDNGAMYMISNETDVVTGNPVVVVYHAANGADMKGTRVWIHKKAGSSGAPLRTVGFSTFDGEDFDTEATSGIMDIVCDKTTIDMYNDDNVYDLMGRIVGKGSPQGLQKGIYIFRGEKIYIR